MVRKTGKGPSRRERRREATSERIIAASLEVLRNEGLEALTIKRLAKDTDYAVGSLYRYFSSKGAVLAAVEARLIVSIRADLASALELLEAELEKRGEHSERRAALLRVLIAGLVYEAQAELRPVQFGMLSRTMGDSSHLVGAAEFAVVEPELVGLLGRVSQLFAAAAKAGALKPGNPKHRTTTFWAAIHGALRVHKLHHFGLKGLGLEQLPSHTRNSLLLAWGASPTVLEASSKQARRIVRLALAPRS